MSFFAKGRAKGSQIIKGSQERKQADWDQAGGEYVAVKRDSRCFEACNTGGRHSGNSKGGGWEFDSPTVYVRSSKVSIFRYLGHWGRKGWVQPGS